MRALFLLWVAVVGCADRDGRSAAVDAGDVDAAEMDAGGADAGSIDAGHADAETDTSTPILDAGDVDAGPLGCECTLGELCVDERCVASRTLRIVAFELDGDSTATTVAACLYEAGWRGALVAEEGPCRVYQSNGSHDWTGDVGTVTVRPALAASETRNPTSGCDSQPASGLDLFSSGDIVTFNVAGGADVPFFDEEVPALSEARILSAGLFRPGEPLEVSWDPSGDEGTVRVALVHVVPPADEVYVTCDDLPAAAGRVAIPGALTAMLAPREGAVLRLTRSNIEHLPWREVQIELEVASVEVHYY